MPWKIKLVHSWYNETSDGGNSSMGISSGYATTIYRVIDKAFKSRVDAMNFIKDVKYIATINQKIFYSKEEATRYIRDHSVGDNLIKWNVSDYIYEPPPLPSYDDNYSCIICNALMSACVQTEIKTTIECGSSSLPIDARKHNIKYNPRFNNTFIHKLHQQLPGKCSCPQWKLSDDGEAWIKTPNPKIIPAPKPFKYIKEYRPHCEAILVLKKTLEDDCAAQSNNPFIIRFLEEGKYRLRKVVNIDPNEMPEIFYQVFHKALADQCSCNRYIIKHSPPTIQPGNI